MSKLYTHAGVSKLNGQFKVRFANDALRTKVLIKNGHTDIDIVELKTPMTKEDAVAYLLSIDFATQNGSTNAAVQAALEAEVGKRSEKPAKAPKAAKTAVKQTKTAVKQTAPAKAKVTMPTDMEDAPF
jgi:hypothetical protein